MVRTNLFDKAVCDRASYNTVVERCPFIKDVKTLMYQRMIVSLRTKDKAFNGSGQLTL